MVHESFIFNYHDFHKCTEMLLKLQSCENGFQKARRREEETMQKEESENWPESQPARASKSLKGAAYRKMQLERV